jgi:hypothetical protein
MPKKVEIICDYQPYMENPPQARSLYGQACTNDAVTVNQWRDTWIRNAKVNHERFGPFKDRGLGKLWGIHRNSPAFVLGSGPSLRANAHLLKDNPGIPVLSCLHNFHFLEDLGVNVDYYVSLDAGPVVIEEVSEGGSKTPDEYWDATKGKTLICYISTDPGLLEKWQGNVFFFNCPVPDVTILEEMDKQEPFHTFVSTGGNVLGASTYIAKAIMGCNPLVFLGADFSFSYLDKFHGWDSKYDKEIGHCIRTTDVYGNSVKTWPSYHNFKAWFDWLSMTVPGFYINCTEGGTFGAYAGGNIRSVIQMDLAEYLKMQKMCDEIKEQCVNPETGERKILF